MTDPLGPRMRWWGWGVDGHDVPLPRAATAMLRDELGVGGARAEPVALASVALAEPVLGDELRAQLAAAVGGGDSGAGRDYVRDDRLTRVTHAAGRSYPDLIRLRGGRELAAPDAVVYPKDHGEVAALLALCTREQIAVIPFGGGTSVVGGVDALRGPHRAAISLDLARTSGLRELDTQSQLATFGAGTTGPELERTLQEHDLTLGHFPQSYEFSTVGGWAATRSAGQASTGYGRIDELVVALRAATPSGDLDTLPVPASAAGPDLRQLLLGSEGTLGVITEVTLRVRPRAPAQRLDAYALPGFATATNALRVLAQAGIAPDLARLSDPEETRVSLALSGSPAAARLLRAYMAARTRSPATRARPRASGARAPATRTPQPLARTTAGAHASPCLTILGFDGTRAEIADRRRRARAALRRHGAIALGPAPGNAWAKGRFHGAYVRDELLGRRVLVDTLETATTWSQLGTLHHTISAALNTALSARGTPPIVMCHVSHLYPTGASLYFTFLARQQPDRELEQWQAAKQAAGDAISAAGATITHHHAVGRDHAPWLRSEIGELGVGTLRAVKQRLDPAGVMNPGKLLG